MMLDISLWFFYSTPDRTKNPKNTIKNKTTFPHPPPPNQALTEGREEPWLQFGAPIAKIGLRWKKLKHQDQFEVTMAAVFP